MNTSATTHCKLRSQSFLSHDAAGEETVTLSKHVMSEEKYSVFSGSPSQASHAAALE
jgi:hypothetical protein